MIKQSQYLKITLMIVIIYLSASFYLNLLFAQTDSSLKPFRSIDDAKILAEDKLLKTLSELNFNSSLHPGHTNSLTGKWDVDHLNRNEWTSGFFSGSLWYMYQLTGDKRWADYATQWTKDLEPVSELTHDHDAGFRIFNSFGNGYKLTQQRTFYRTILRAATILSRRYNPDIKAIKSWDWIGNFPVIIDNMMNLEILFWTAEVTANKYLFEIALNHADFTLTHHMRPDGSTHHIVDVANDGSVIEKFTTQGCDSRSRGCGDTYVWARGQAWAIYGFTMTYRFTGEERFLQAAIDASGYFIDNLPDDFIPFYDFLEPISSVRSKDTSAAAIAASAFIELFRYTQNEQYFNTSVEILESLMTDTYSNKNTGSNSILRKSTLHRGMGNLGTSYADYYFLESIIRYMEIGSYILPEISMMNTLYLDQNYPNPFNNQTTIYYSLENEGLTNLSVYDVSGRKVQTIINEFLPSGTYSTSFDGNGLSSGIYFYILKSNGNILTRKMTLLK